MFARLFHNSDKKTRREAQIARRDAVKQRKKEKRTRKYQRGEARRVQLVESLVYTTVRIMDRLADKGGDAASIEIDINHRTLKDKLSWSDYITYINRVRDLGYITNRLYHGEHGAIPVYCLSAGSFKKGCDKVTKTDKWANMPVDRLRDAGLKHWNTKATESLTFIIEFGK